MIRPIQNIGNSRIFKSVKNTAAYKFVSDDISETIIAGTCGKRYVKMHRNGSIFKAAKLGARQLYKRKGLFPVITGAAGFFTALPGGSTIGVTTGSLLRKGLKTIYRSNFVQSALKVLKFIK